ncbi:hypothetical protein ACJ73_09126 [Blastomyces percursus]|uniref:Uncharacterized protein n=1 Tax=Blastomyces percursus TaxID=1658174 RepID=A0A1J9PBW0_9EURO|nr:hypothetical protein ACJ73_09126 [Blastomyces percursus]
MEWDQGGLVIFAGEPPSGHPQRSNPDTSQPPPYPHTLPRTGIKWSPWLRSPQVLQPYGLFDLIAVKSTDEPVPLAPEERRHGQNQEHRHEREEHRVGARGHAVDRDQGRDADPGGRRRASCSTRRRSRVRARTPTAMTFVFAPSYDLKTSFIVVSARAPDATFFGSYKSESLKSSLALLIISYVDILTKSYPGR